MLTPQDIIRDPFVLEFAGLPQKKQYKEGELEAALKANMEKFLLELGRGFAFVGRQFVMHIGSRRLKVDLVFYHCILKCYVLIDLKRGEIKHGDIGQHSKVLRINFLLPDTNYTSQSEKNCRLNLTRFLTNIPNDKYVRQRFTFQYSK